MTAFFRKALVLLGTWGLSQSLLYAAPKDVKDDIKATLGFVPTFVQGMPPSVLEGAWTELKDLQINPNTALPGKYKELIGLAVASQIPCSYCIYSHTEVAKLNGATQEELSEAIGLAAAARHWSTYMNGLQLNEKSFQLDVKKALKGMASKQPQQAMPVIEVKDAESALKDIKQTFGFVPGFLSAFPKEGLAGAWIHMKNIELSPEAALPGKYRSLIGLAVSSQIPCHYCIFADTEFAKAEGASEREIREAVAMASLTRLWSTHLNGGQVSLDAYKKDFDRIVKNAKDAMETAAR